MHYCLFDVLHEQNTKQKREILRRTKFVPQLAGQLNTQVAEQLHRAVKRDLTICHLAVTFLMRLILQQRNERINDQAVKDIGKEQECMCVLKR